MQLTRRGLLALFGAVLAAPFVKPRKPMMVGFWRGFTVLVSDWRPSPRHPDWSRDFDTAFAEVKGGALGPSDGPPARFVREGDGFGTLKVDSWAEPERLDRFVRWDAATERLVNV